MLQVFLLSFQNMSLSFAAGLGEGAPSHSLNLNKLPHPHLGSGTSVTQKQHQEGQRGRLDNEPTPVLFADRRGKAQSEFRGQRYFAMLFGIYQVKKCWFPLTAVLYSSAAHSKSPWLRGRFDRCQPPMIPRFSLKV